MIMNIRKYFVPTYSVIVLCICGGIPFLLTVLGYGSYMHGALFIVALFTTMVLGAIIVIFWHSVCKLINRSDAHRVSRAGTCVMLVSMSVSFILGQYAGAEVRIAHCGNICEKLDAVVEAVERYKLSNDVYPSNLYMVPGIQGVIEKLDITIGEGRLFEDGFDADVLSRADATIFFKNDGYLCIVPVEKMLPISFTSFAVFSTATGESMWRYDRVLWKLQLSSR